MVPLLRWAWLTYPRMSRKLLRLSQGAAQCHSNGMKLWKDLFRLWETFYEIFLFNQVLRMVPNINPSYYLLANL